MDKCYIVYIGSTPKIVAMTREDAERFIDESVIRQRIEYGGIQNLDNDDFPWGYYPFCLKSDYFIEEIEKFQ